mgnify:CR=1 FL=1|jgi:hypothetical protein
MTNETTNMAAEYVASYRFMQDERHNNPAKDVSMAKNRNKKNSGGRYELLLSLIQISNIVNASLRKFWKPVMLHKQNDGA